MPLYKCVLVLWSRVSKCYGWFVGMIRGFEIGIPKKMGSLYIMGL
jgi:hypothetical protein